MAVETQMTFFLQVYCPGCNRVVKYQIDEPPATHGNDHKAQDVICPDFFYVIATFPEGGPGEVRSYVLGAGEV
jgi:hypothetical protein